MLLCVRTVIDHKWHKNVVKTLVRATFLVPTTFWRHLWSTCFTEQTHSTMELIRNQGSEEKGVPCSEIYRGFINIKSIGHLDLATRHTLRKVILRQFLENSVSSNMYFSKSHRKKIQNPSLYSICSAEILMAACVPSWLIFPVLGFYEIPW